MHLEENYVQTEVTGFQAYNPHRLQVQPGMWQTMPACPASPPRPPLAGRPGQREASAGCPLPGQKSRLEQGAGPGRKLLRVALQKDAEYQHHTWWREVAPRPRGSEQGCPSPSWGQGAERLT